jgi:hypothetical protein
VQAFFEAAGQAWRLRARVEAAPALLGRRNLDGWLVGADLVRHHGGIHVGYWGADLVLSATLRRFADALFTGVAIGVGTSKRTQRYLFDDIDPHAVR